MPGQAALAPPAAPSGNRGSHYGKRAQRHQSEQDVLNKKPACGDNRDTQQEPSGTVPGLDRNAAEAAFQSSGWSPLLRGKDFEEILDADQQHQDNRD